MTKKRKPNLIKDVCRRGCGTELYSLDKSLYGADSVRLKYQFICSDCLSAEEKEEMLNAMSSKILTNLKG